MGVIENLKEAATLVQQVGNLDLYRKLIESEREVERLEAHVKELEKTLSLKTEMKYRDRYYYQDDDHTPFCPARWESKNQAIHLHTLMGPSGGFR